MKRSLWVLAGFLFWTSVSWAQVPRFVDVTGYEPGVRVAPVHDVVRYVEAVAAASDRVTMKHLGMSQGGRPLVQLIVTSPANQSRLEAIRTTARQLADPRSLSREDEQRALENQPVMVWFSGSIHGGELSATEGLLLTIEALTTRNDPETLRMLDQAVVVITPIINVDGRDMAALHIHSRLGRHINPDPAHWSGAYTGWESQSFRTGHRFFDHNRDWFAHTQPESAIFAQAIQHWAPQVGVDMHEMGSDVEFYVDPPTDPVGPFFPNFATRWFERFGAAHARAFDAIGTDYMLAERFNFFYPGYGTSYLSYQGAVGMLYEQGQTRGLALERVDGSVRTLQRTAQQQHVLNMAALELSVNERRTLLQEYVQSLREGIADGQQGMRRYFLPPGTDPQRARHVAEMLQRNGIEVQELTAAVELPSARNREGQTVSRVTLPAGTFVIDAAQPRNRLVRVLLEPDVPIPATFLEQARARVDRGENPRFYDITAWSVPLLYDVPAFSSADARALSTRPIPPATRAPLAEAAYAYVMDGGQTATPAALFHLRAAGHRVAMLTKATRFGERVYQSGSGIVYVGDDASVHADVRAVLERFSLEATAMGSGMADRGFPSLGSGDVVYLNLPRIALVAEEPFQPNSFGWSWHILDGQYQLPVTVLRAAQVPSVRLHDFDVLILPETADTSTVLRAWGRPAMQRIAGWVRDGGTLITLGNATELARGPLGLIALRSWNDLPDNRGALPVVTPGAFVRTELHPDTWLTSGYASAPPALVNSGRMYIDPTGAPSPNRRTVVRFATENLRIAGHLWQESLERLPGGVLVYEERAGRGRVVAFTEDPGFRGYWWGLHRMYLNAVVFGKTAP